MSIGNVHPFARGAIALAAALGLLVLSAASLAADVTPFAVSLPKVTGPIPSTADDFPYIADGFDVQPPVPDGYVEEEFFFSGTGNVYEFTSTGIRIATCPATATLGCTNIPYTTRMLVKRPKNRHQFSGTVVIEPLNPSANFDIAAVWDRSRDYFTGNGDVFVGWSSKSVIINTLKGWNPTRYAPLSWTYAPFTPGGNSGAYDGITFDIAAQIGALFKVNGPESPLHGWRIEHVFEAGFSQDGSFTFTQAEVFHALERLPGGGPIYDGYVPGGTTGPSNINFGLTSAGGISRTDPRHQMQPRDVPVIHINTETELFLAALAPLYRRPDSDALDDRYRLWEVPGASHVSNDARDPALILQLNLAELQRIAPEDLAPVGCTHQLFVNGTSQGIPGVVDPNDYPFAFVANAAFHALTLWIERGVSPPHAGPIQLDSSTTPPSIVRDAFGNAMGGVRTPFLDVPITTYVPIDTVAHATAFSGFCILYGYNVPFDATRLHSLYRNHGDYVVRVVVQSARLVEEGFWLHRDAIEAIQRAVHADVP
jgi:alpha/beta hydrolase family protein